MIKKLFALLIVSIAMLSMFAGCQTLPQAPKPDHRVSEQVPVEPAPPQSAESAAAKAPLQSSVGTARYYANRFHGHKTASGEIYNQKKMTAAHESLPFGTLVKVENLANSLSVIVKVNDRCRKHEEVFIDVSREAALELGFLRHGTAKVRITVVKDNPSSKVPAAAKN